MKSCAADVVYSHIKVWYIKCVVVHFLKTLHVQVIKPVALIFLTRQQCILQILHRAREGFSAC